MVATTDSLLGIGLYTPAEAALYLGIPVQTMRRWLYGNRMGDAVLEPQLADGGERFVTFLDFVQALHIRQIRADYQIPLPTIRQGLQRARNEYGVRYPFAMRHTTCLYGQDLVVKLGDDRYVQLTGEHAHHQMIKQIVDLYSKDLAFDASSLASRYRAWAYEQIEIWMDPRVRFGEPMLSCGYTAKALWEAAKAEGSIQGAAEVYGVNAAEVEAAYRYYTHLKAASSI